MAVTNWFVSTPVVVNDALPADSGTGDPSFPPAVWNCTVPVAVRAPVTVAVRVTAEPNCAGLGAWVTPVEDDALFIVSVPGTYVKAYLLDTPPAQVTGYWPGCEPRAAVVVHCGAVASDRAPSPGRKPL